MKVRNECGCDIDTPFTIWPEDLIGFIGFKADALYRTFMTMSACYFGEDYSEPTAIKELKMFREWLRKQKKQANKHRANKGNIKKRYNKKTGDKNSTTPPTTTPTTSPTTPPTTTPTTTPPTVLPVYRSTETTQQPVLPVADGAIGRSIDDWITGLTGKSDQTGNGEKVSSNGGDKTVNYSTAAYAFKKHLNDDNAYFSGEYDAATICIAITDDINSLNRWKQLARQKGEIAVIEEANKFWHEIVSGEDVRNRGAALNKRLGDLPDTTERKEA